MNSGYWYNRQNLGGFHQFRNGKGHKRDQSEVEIRGLHQSQIPGSVSLGDVSKDRLFLNKYDRGQFKEAKVQSWKEH